LATVPSAGPKDLGLGVLARPSGALAMVAIDQRESLHTMFAKARGNRVTDQIIVDFKLAAAEVLAPYASAMLFDRKFSMPAFKAAGIANPACGRILAADALVQEEGGDVQDSDIDSMVPPAWAREQGAVALKLLLIWRGDETAARSVDIAGRFVEACHGAGLVAVVEGIVRNPSTATESWSRETAIVEAARALGAVQPDLYKCQVPFAGVGEASSIVDVCEQITGALPCPWVVLSAGVNVNDYPRAVEIACKAGASGFLAGRAIWGDMLAGEDYRAQIEKISLARLRNLVEIVDNSARPWFAAVR
jgi:sulfofructosephosphate aldolase